MERWEDHLRKSSVQIGKDGEDMACEFLLKRNYSILKRNFNYSGGEVDIIAVETNVLHMVEVKSWRDIPPAEIEGVLDNRKWQRIARGAAIFLKDNFEYYDYAIQFDLIFINLSKKTIDFYEDIFYWDR